MWRCQKANNHEPINGKGWMRVSTAGRDIQTFRCLILAATDITMKYECTFVNIKFQTST